MEMPRVQDRGLEDYIAGVLNVVGDGESAGQRITATIHQLLPER